MSTGWPPGTVCVLVTVGEDGAPHAIPVSAALRDGPDVLLALAPRRGSLARLRADARVVLLVVAADLAVSLHGRAEDLGRQTAGVHAIRITVDEERDHLRPTFAIDAGVAWRWTQDDAAARDGATRQALAALRRHPG